MMMVMMIVTTKLIRTHDGDDNYDYACDGGGDYGSVDGDADNDDDNDDNDNNMLSIQIAV